MRSWQWRLQARYLRKWTDARTTRPSPPGSDQALLLLDSAGRRGQPVQYRKRKLRPRHGRRSDHSHVRQQHVHLQPLDSVCATHSPPDRKSTRLNSSHSQISYAVFCLKKKKKINNTLQEYNTSINLFTTCLVAVTFVFTPTEFLSL